MEYTELIEKLRFASKYEKRREYNEINVGELMEEAADYINKIETPEEWVDFRGKPQCPRCKSVFREYYIDYRYCPVCGKRLFRI